MILDSMNIDPKKVTLTDILDNHYYLAQKIMEHEGDVTDFLNEIEMNNELLASKIDSYYQVILLMESEGERFKQISEKYSRQATRCATSAAFLKEKIKFTLDNMGVEKISGNEITFYKGQQTQKLLIDLNSLSKEYLIEKIEQVANRELIEEKIDQGIDVPGVEVQRSFTLRTKIAKK